MLGYKTLAGYLASNIAFSAMLLGVLVLHERLTHDVAALALTGGDAATSRQADSLRDRGGHLLHFWIMAAFDVVLAGSWITALRTPPRSPQANAYAERWVRGLRRELLDRTIIWNQQQLR